MVPAARELELWALLWAKPQALEWQKAAQELEVALYVRNLALVETGESSVSLGVLLRQQADALGLTIPGMRVNRWRIAADAVGEKRAQHGHRDDAVAVAPARASARDRFRVVRGDDTAV